MSSRRSRGNSANNVPDNGTSSSIDPRTCPGSSFCDDGDDDDDGIGGADGGGSWRDDPLFRSLNREVKLSIVERDDGEPADGESGSTSTTTATRRRSGTTSDQPGNNGSSNSNQNNRKKKRVRFVASPAACHFLPALDELPPSERRARWWRPDDFYFFQRAARRACRDARLLDGAALRDFERGGYSGAQYLALTLEEQEVEALLASPEVGNPAVTAWCCGAQPHARGLEHWASRRHAGCRHEAMRECLRVVVELSRDCHEAPPEIAKQSREYSRASRILARWFGQADAAAARDEDDDDDPRVSTGKAAAAAASFRKKQQQNTTGKDSSCSRKNCISSRSIDESSNSSSHSSKRTRRRRGSAKHSTPTVATTSAPPPPGSSSSPFANLPLLSGRLRRRSSGGPVADMPSRKLGLRHKIFR